MNNETITFKPFRKIWFHATTEAAEYCHYTRRLLGFGASWFIHLKIGRQKKNLMYVLVIFFQYSDDSSIFSPGFYPKSKMYLNGVLSLANDTQ